MAEDTTPMLFPFIKLRYERFGGLIFNPYFNTEVKLNRREAYIASICDGRNRLDEIEKSVKARFSLSAIDSERLVADTLHKLMDAMALDLYKVVISSSLPKPGIPSFSRKGPYLSAPKNVVWNITYACNLHCSHCLSASGKALKSELDTAESLKLVDLIADAGIFSVVLSGGEPFMRPDILTILRRIAEHRLSMEIITNGLLVTDEVVHELVKLPIYHVHVSIDGIEGTHDALRGRKGSFHAACKAIRRLNRENIGVSMNVTINAKNITELDRLIDLAINLRCVSFLVNIFLPVGRGKEHPELTLSGTQLLNVSRKLTKRMGELEGTLHISRESCSSFLFESPRPKASRDGPVGCSAGNNTLCIGPDGIAYPCPFLLDFPLGNVLEIPIKQIWNESSVLRTLRGIRKKDMGEPCGSCGYAPKPCGCGCRAAAYIETGDITAADITCFMPLMKENVIS